MAQELIMPKLGNTVETVVIIEWRKSVGDAVVAGDILCEVETDKATVEVEAEQGGILLAQLAAEDDEVAVLAPYAVVGQAGEDISSFAPTGGQSEEASPKTPEALIEESPASVAKPASASVKTVSTPASGISPRARNLATDKGLDGWPAQGSGPGGRIIERDVQAALDGRAPLTPAAQAVGGAAPQKGSGLGGRVLAADMGRVTAPSAEPAALETFPGPVESIPVKGVRKVIAQRMHASLLETAQLTLNATASAESLLAWRAGYKHAAEEWGLGNVSLNDLVMFSVSRLLPRHPELNATFLGGEILRYRHVHLGFAVDTPKGLMVPVIPFADRLSLVELSAETRRLAGACRDGNINPDELSGGTFTVTNLGAFGIESFTPVLNAPEVAILGVAGIVNRPVEKADGTLGLEKRMGLSLTIDHQAVDGAPGARFLKDLSAMLGNLEIAAAL